MNINNKIINYDIFFKILGESGKCCSFSPQMNLGVVEEEPKCHIYRSNQTFWTKIII